MDVKATKWYIDGWGGGGHGFNDGKCRGRKLRSGFTNAHEQVCFVQFMIQCFAITLNTDNFETLTVDFF